jgi:hypothetical protein
MEPLVIFDAGLVIYCGFIALFDSVRDFRQQPDPGEQKAPAKARVYQFRKSPPAAAGRGGGAAARWRVPKASSA